MITAFLVYTLYLLMPHLSSKQIFIFNANFSFFSFKYIEILLRDLIPQFNTKNSLFSSKNSSYSFTTFKPSKVFSFGNFPLFLLRIRLKVETFLYNFDIRILGIYVFLVSRITVILGVQCCLYFFQPQNFMILFCSFIFNL